MSRTRLTLKGVRVRPVIVPLQRPIVSKVGLFQDWPLILIDLYTNEGIVGHSYLEPYLKQSARYIVPAIEDLVEAAKGQPVAPFDASSAVLEQIALREARGLGATETDAMDAATVASRALQHDLVVRARHAERRGACRRETPIAFTMDGDARGAVLVEGVVDLAFEEDGVWTVVDYKTDRELASLGEERYRRQVALYATAIARATGRSARGVIVRI